MEADPQELYRLTPATFSQYDQVLFVIFTIIITITITDYECDGGAERIFGERRHSLGRVGHKGERPRGNALLQVSVIIMIMMTHKDDHDDQDDYDDNVHDDEAKARRREVRFQIEFCDLGADKAKMWCLAPSDCHRSRKILILHNSDDLYIIGAVCMSVTFLLISFSPFSRHFWV